MVTDGARGPIDGDLVRAREDRLDGGIVEGILRLRYVPLADYVQVNVEDERGSHSIVADTIEVLQPSVDVVADDDVDDPLRPGKGWRRIVSLEEARLDHLVHRPFVPPGMTSHELTATVLRMIQPIVDIGWTVDDVSHRVEWDGVEVLASISRSGQLIDVKYDATRDCVVVYPESKNDPDEPTEPIGGVSRPTVGSCRDLYRELGLV